jgi:two-component system sensor histidine kinase BaeS
VHKASSIRGYASHMKSAMKELSPPVTHPSRQRSLSLRASLDRLRVKLFIAIAGANALLAVVAYLLFSWTFDQAFVEQLNRSDEARLAGLTATLAEGYGREKSWEWLVNDRDRWSTLIRDALGIPRRGGATGGGEPPATPGAARELPLTINPRLLLFDSERKLLIGSAELAPEAVMRPIIWQGDVVGYLGAVPRPELVETIDRVFSEQQNRRFGAVALGMLAAALALGAGLAYWLTQRIRSVAAATAALTRGEYDVRLEVAGRDELDQLSADFNELADTLATTRRARQQWIADIAHELRTPLAVLRGEIEALQDGVRPLERESLGSLAQEVGRLGRLVENLHLLSLSDLGALSIHNERFDLGELIRETVAAQQRALDAKGLEVRLQLSSEAIVLADETRLAQVFANLMQNTLRYTDAPGRLEIALRRKGEWIAVDWQDSSPGVARDELGRLTDRLFRVDASRSRAGGGSGLGLAIVKAIIDAHGGTIIARQSPLGGLWLEIALPAAAETISKRG